ncbi:MAG TPA: hypothetical protein VF792_01140 [Ktedonobacterales bacterium]
MDNTTTPSAYPYPPTYTPQSTAGAPTAPSQPPYGQPPYGQPPYGHGQPPYGQPPYGQSPYGQPTPAQPPYGPAYNASGYPGAYAPGADWRPSETPAGPPWRRIISGVVGMLILIAVIASAYTQMHGHSSSSANGASTLSADAYKTLLSDSLMSNTHGWSTDIAHCYFDQDGYHVRNGYMCFAPIGVQDDYTQTVTAKQVSGSPTQAYGLVLRRASQGNYYFFGIDANSGWIFELVVNDKVTRLQNFTRSYLIQGGLDTENTLSVTATGSTFDCYVNGQKLGTIHDSTFGAGKSALVAPGQINVAFTNYLAKV